LIGLKGKALFYTNYSAFSYLQPAPTELASDLV